MNCLQNPPALKINDVLFKDHRMPVHVRVEQRIVWNLLLVLEKNGFVPYRMDDGDEVIPTRSKKTAMEELFNRDDAYLFLRHKHDRGFAGHEGSVRTVWVRFVFGNELDIISDYNATNHRGFQDIMDKFNPEDFA